MDELVATIDTLATTNKDPSVFYTQLSNYKLIANDFNYFYDFIIPKIYYLYEKQLIRKDLLYIALLANENNRLLEKFLEYDKAIFQLDINDPVSLYDYFIYYKQHWFYHVLNSSLNATPNDVQLFHHQSDNIYTKIQLLQFIQATNARHLLNLNEINDKFLLQINIDNFHDCFWKFYVQQIDQFVDIAKFCRLKDNENDIFAYASCHSLLGTISHYMDLCDEQRWHSVIKKIEQHNEIDEYNLFIGFTVIGTLINLLELKECHNTNSRDINTVLDNIKLRLIHLNRSNKQLQIELLENIFSLIFYHHGDFVCREKQIRLILHLLKVVIDEIKLKKLFDKDSKEFERVTQLNKYLSDALWRLELIINAKNITTKTEDQLMNYMLAPAESLIHICLKRNNFERAYQVVEIFNLQNTHIAQEISFTERFLKFRTKQLRKSPKDAILHSVQDFFEKNPPPRINHNTEQPKTDHDYYYFIDPNETFINLFDLTLTHSTSENCEEMLKLILKWPEGRHQMKLIELSQEIHAKEAHKSPVDILISPEYSLELSSYLKKCEFHANLAKLYDLFHTELQERTDEGVLNKNHASHKILLKIGELFPGNYLQKVYNYLHAFSKILYIEEDTSDIVSQGRNASYFHLLDLNRSELIGKLLFERQLDPSEFEKYFAKLKLDFLYHIVGNCFPTINLHVQEHVTIEELYHDNMLYTPSHAIIEYIEKRNWLLAFILQEMYKIDGTDVSEMRRLQQFFNYMKLRRIQTLKVIFDRNDIVTALQNCISAQKVKMYLEEHIVKQDLMSIASLNSNNSEISEQVDEQGEEMLEESKTTNWKWLFDVLESIPETELRKKAEFLRTRNSVIVNLVQDCFEPEFYKYVRFISDRSVRIETVVGNVKKWPGQFAADIIQAEVTRFDSVDDHAMDGLREIGQQIDLYEKLKNVLGTKSWYKSLELCAKDPAEAIDKILQLNDVEILLNFIQLNKLNNEILLQIESNYLTKIMELAHTPLPQIKTLLDCLPFSHAINICNNLLTILRNLTDLQFIANYLADNVPDDTFVKNVQVALKMLSAFSAQEQDQMFCLISEPLSILEVLIMNTKLDKLGLVLETLNLHNANEFDANIISIDKIDQLLRMYAEKSLDFRVMITQPNPKLLKTPECKLLQSLDSLNLEKRPFNMPETVPPKAEWVQNEEVVECMCCHSVTFSMFNRRHHCRRCGRVVCYSCSQKRMLVQDYGDILVRVCAECYEQTMGKHNSSASDKSEGVLSSIRSAYEFWVLNDDPGHNQIVREEFSYEHAPSISLCLSILKYHSKSPECPKFLLEQCEVMLKLLQPNQETSEIDYLLVIKMLKSLAMAAKMQSNEHMLSAGSTLADRILSQAELLALLAEKGCLNLMSGGTSSYIDAAVLRRLRDKLLQREQWKLALEVSTKAGLDNAGVFAAWGKSCLKAGSLQLAREKFQRCLERNNQYENNLLTASLRRSTLELNRSTDSLPTTKRTRYSSSRSSGDRTNSKNNPPLLNEIIQILETKTRHIRPEILNDTNLLAKFSESTTSLNQLSIQQIDTAISITNRIKNLQTIAGGNYNLTTRGGKTNQKIDAVFYDECLYYLSKYGSCQSLLEFYVKHGDVDKALIHMVENRLGSDVFVEIYMKCLKDGVVNVLQENMSKIDSSLDLWKEYLKQICRHLEKQNLLNCLYQLQLYIGDYVRAAMTCIRFYQENVKSFSELANNVAYLHKGEEHLKQVLEQEQWVEVTSVSDTESRASFEEKMLTNPDLVMKIDSKDIDKHINTFKKQIEVVEYLAKCETAGARTAELVREIQLQRETKVQENKTIPTLFGTTFDKITLAVLVMVSSQEGIEDGFPLAMQLVHEFKLRPIRVYCIAGKQLARMERYKGISQLVNCIKSSGYHKNDTAISDMLDEMLVQAVGTLIKNDIGGTKVEELIKLIRDRATKISAYIEAKQLKTAYFLAVKYKRTADIRRIQSEAELLNMPSIKALCQKVLQASSSTHSTKE